MVGLDQEVENRAAEEQLLKRAIPFQDRVLVKLLNVDPGRTPGGLYEVEKTRMKYAKEAIEGTAVRVGARVTQIRDGDKVWLDRKTWVPGARYVVVRERDVLAAGDHEVPT